MNHATTQSVDANGAADTIAKKSTAAGQGKPATFASIYQPIETQLAEVETLLVSELQSDTPYVDQLLEHSRMLGGKRMRPILLLLAGGSCGSLTSAHVTVAAALEMIHLATLIHDDVIDESETRRHRPTAHQKWGNKTSVLLGDYLFTHSFSLASKANSIGAIQMLATASNRVCEGEMKQNFWQGNFELSEKDYLQLIGEKTGELCSVACGMGALLSEAPATQIDEFSKFGRDLGASFQIVDDVLDLVGDPSTVGKTLGTDLVNQKPTLPIIHAIATLEGSAQDEFLSLIRSKSPNIHEPVMKTLEETGSIKYARDKAAALATEAMQFAELLTQNATDATRPTAQSLAEVGNFILQRTF